ncbi:polysaccharide deacetylase family protein [Chlamydia muridarum]|uniref:polysaccharide deacetylase family protein n=1 Tax=Chlamydia muridarum TaxID=83560 RepID=UPI000D025E5B|nr:polysaccharide deacetylase family protein [Chlamydia muridarum]AVM88493.1 polysaccharide deacetylase [Chlamydia muridarum str. Nigg]
MLRVLAYRQVAFSKFPYALRSFLDFLHSLKQHYSFILPGDPLPNRKAIILTFDYASVDFYKHVFPFLQKFQIPAVVGVAWRYVSRLESENLPIDMRISPSDFLAFQDEIFSYYQPFCSVKELCHMAQSSIIRFASSGFAIRNLKNSPPYLHTEISLSKILLEEAIQAPLEVFFYPFGKSDLVSQHFVQEVYRYSFVLGDAASFFYSMQSQHSIPRIDMALDSRGIPSLYQLSFRQLKRFLILH